MTRTRKVILLVVVGLAGWMYYNYTTNKAFEESPEGLDRTARFNSLDIGRPVRSATGILFLKDSGVELIVQDTRRGMTGQNNLVILRRIIVGRLMPQRHSGRGA